MIKNLLTSTLALTIIALTSPGFSFTCAMPCKMTQAQMLDCARRCSADKPATSLSKGDCIQMHVKAAPLIDAVSAAKLQAPEFAMLSVPQISVNVPVPQTFSLIALRGPPLNSPAEHPSAHAPPQLI